MKDAKGRRCLGAVPVLGGGQREGTAPSCACPCFVQEGEGIRHRVRPSRTSPAHGIFPFHPRAGRAVQGQGVMLAAPSPPLPVLGWVRGVQGLPLCHGPHLGSRQRLGGTGGVLSSCPQHKSLPHSLLQGRSSSCPPPQGHPHCPTVATFVPTVTPRGLPRCLLSPGAGAGPPLPRPPQCGRVQPLLCPHFRPPWRLHLWNFHPFLSPTFPLELGCIPRLGHAPRNPPALRGLCALDSSGVGIPQVPGDPQGPAGDEQGPAGTRCSSSGRVCARAWHCLTKMRWALPELPVIAPGAKNSLPDKDAFLGAVGRILGGTSFVSLDPPSTLVWGGEGTPGGIHIPGFAGCGTRGLQDMGMGPFAHHSLFPCSKQSTGMLSMGTEAWISHSLSPKKLTMEVAALSASLEQKEPVGGAVLSQHLPFHPHLWGSPPRGTGLSCHCWEGQDFSGSPSVLGVQHRASCACAGRGKQPPVLCPCPSVSLSSHPSLVMPPRHRGWCHFPGESHSTGNFGGLWWHRETPAHVPGKLLGLTVISGAPDPKGNPMFPPLRVKIKDLKAQFLIDLEGKIKE
ncbi:uncharacterized protein LOC134562839 isoform X1 [Prinia subflava]|uniref:uncharacterized protein LOC134562839 isoform X1 n=1 Tax=Prinia subflava TaxID=208062 RepID=UPI002FE02895